MRDRRVVSIVAISEESVQMHQGSALLLIPFGLYGQWTRERGRRGKRKRSTGEFERIEIRSKREKRSARDETRKNPRRLAGSVSRFVVPESKCNELRQKRQKGNFARAERGKGNLN